MTDLADRIADALQATNPTRLVMLLLGERERTIIRSVLAGEPPPHAPECTDANDRSTVEVCICTEHRTGATIAIRDRIVVTPDIVVTVNSIDVNDGHVYLFEVDEWPVSLAIGKVQVVDVIPGHVDETGFYQSVTDMDADTAAVHATAVEAHNTRRDRP